MKFPNISSLVRVSMLICKDSLHLMITSWPYAIYNSFKYLEQECKRVIRPFKKRSEPIDEWIRNMVDIGYHAYDETWVKRNDF